MRTLPLLPVACALLLSCVVAAWVLSRHLRAEEAVLRRLASVGGAGRAGGQAVPFASAGGGQALLRRLGGALLGSGLLSRKTIEGLEQTLTAAGYRGSQVLPLFLGAKAGLLVALPLVGFLAVEWVGLTGLGRMVAIAGAAIGGLLLPDLVARRTRKRYLARFEHGLPDALDLLVICAEAGLPLEAGIERVAAEMRRSNKPTSNELDILSSELKILPDRRQALLNMGQRTGLDTVVQLSGTLAQTLQFGTPLTQALRVLSAEMRERTLVRFEERAARLPVLLTVPMVLFILPCIFLIVGGPAIIQVLRAVGR